MPQPAQGDPKQKLRKRFKQRKRESNQEGTDTSGGEGKPIIDSTDILIERDEETGKAKPFKAPFIGPAKGQIEYIRQLPIKLKEERDYKIRMIDFEQRCDEQESDLEQKGDYQINQRGEHVGYKKVPLDIYLELINSYLVEPYLGICPEHNSRKCDCDALNPDGTVMDHFTSVDDMTDRIQEMTFDSLFTTIWVFGIGGSTEDSEQVIDQLVDKKK